MTKTLVLAGLLVLASIGITRAQGVTGQMLLSWSNVPTNNLVAAQVTGYLVQHAGPDLQLTNYVIIPVNPLAPPTNWTSGPLPLGLHGFTLSSSNVAGQLDSPSNFATNWLMLSTSPTGLVLRALTPTTATLTFQLAPSP